MSEVFSVLASVFVPFFIYLVVLATVRTPYWATAPWRKRMSVKKDFLDGHVTLLGDLIIHGFDQAHYEAKKSGMSLAKKLLWGFYGFMTAVSVIVVMIATIFIGWWIGHQTFGLMSPAEMMDTYSWIVANFGNGWPVHILTGLWMLAAMAVCWVVIPTMTTISLIEVGIRTSRIFIRCPSESRV